RPKGFENELVSFAEIALETVETEPACWPVRGREPEVELVFAVEWPANLPVEVERMPLAPWSRSDQRSGRLASGSQGRYGYWYASRPCASSTAGVTGARDAPRGGRRCAMHGRDGRSPRTTPRRRGRDRATGRGCALETGPILQSRRPHERT